jgi:hypothetical protein
MAVEEGVSRGGGTARRIRKPEWPQVAVALGKNLAVYPLYAQWLECPVDKASGTLAPSPREVELCTAMARCHLSQTAGDDHAQLIFDNPGHDLGGEAPPGDATLEVLVALMHGKSDAFPGTMSMLWHGFPLSCPRPPKVAEAFFERAGKLRASLMPRVLEVWFWAPMDNPSAHGVNVLWQDALRIADERDAAVLSVFIAGDGLAPASRCSLPFSVRDQFQLVLTVDDLDRAALDEARWGSSMPVCFHRPRASERKSSNH